MRQLHALLMPSRQLRGGLPAHGTRRSNDVGFLRIRHPQVEDITEALWGTRVSSGTVSRLNQRIYEQIDAWRQRPITGTYPYVYLDGVSLKRSWGGEVYVVKPIRTTAAASQERLPAVVPRGAASSDSLSVVLVTFAA